MRQIGKLWMISTPVANRVFTRMNYREWGQFLRERTSADLDLALRLGQDVRGVGR